MNRTQIEQDLIREYAQANNLAGVGSPGFKRELARRYIQAGLGTPQDENDAREGAARDLEEKRRAVERAHRDRYASDPNLRPQAGGKQYHAELGRAYKDAGVDTAEDAEGASGGLLSGLRPLAALAILRGIGQSAESGARGGEAIGQIAAGLLRGVSASSSGLVKVGDAILGVILTPLGKSGQAVAGLAGGIGQAVLAGVGGVGSLAVAGLKLGGALGGGIVGGIVGAGGAIAGAIVGAIVGGGAPGAVVGAAVGVGIASFVLQGITSVLSSVGGAVGQALAGIGEAFGKLLGSVGDGLSAVKGVLSDLVETGKQWSSAALTVSRTGNLSLGAASGVGSLATILTGQPGGLNGIFSGFGEMSQYRGSRLRAFGVPGATGTDPLSDFQKAGAAYQGMNAIQKQLLIGGAFGGNEQVGNLFAQGPGMVNYAVNAARRTQQAPGEVIGEAKLSLDLAVIQNQLDSLRLKLLSALMPALNMGVGAISGWLDKNGKALTDGLMAFGRFMATQFPGYLRTGINAVFEFAKSAASSLPVIAQTGQSLYATFALVGNGLRTLLAGLLGAVAGGVSAIPGVGPTLAAPLFGAANALGRLPGMNPHALDGAFGRMAGAAPDILKRIGAAQDGTNKFLDAAGVHNMSQQDFARSLERASGRGGGPQQVEVTIKLHEREDAIMRISSVVAAQRVRAIMRMGE